MMSFRRSFNPRIYFIADPSVCDGRNVEDVVEAAVNGGATMVQLRDKSNNKAQVMRNASAIKRVLSGRNVPFIINDHVELAVAIGADGVHIGQDDMSAEQARAMIGDECILGITAFTPEHFSAIDPSVIDYAGTGPFYGTKTKPDKPILGPVGFVRLVKISPVPVIGIGGITPQNAEAVLRCGAKGVAMMRSVSEAKDPRSAANEFLELFNNSSL